LKAIPVYFSSLNTQLSDPLAFRPHLTMGLAFAFLILVIRSNQTFTDANYFQCYPAGNTYFWLGSVKILLLCIIAHDMYPRLMPAYIYNLKINHLKASPPKP
jgi:hypothetical protein